MYITDENDIFTYFHVINNINPTSVIDVGMLLMRVGAISRAVKGKSVDAQIRLDAFKPAEMPYLAVYDTIYNTIYSNCLDEIEAEYDLAVALDVAELMSDSEIELLFKWCKVHADYLFVDCKSDIVYKKAITMGQVKTIKIDENEYALICLDKEN